MRPKFYIDENVPFAVCIGLKMRRIDVVSAKELNRLGDDDEAHFHFAQEEKKAIITHDADFLSLAAKEQGNHGLLLFTRHMNIGEAIDEIERIYLAFSAEDLQGRIFFLPHGKQSF
ncbi:DUF5615 family PIN-like protein [Candidatus Woesearchaeota archaeon]|nr:DUF5615 family PIN-like protein [Candidatus Woesearchaeota archaeon]